MLKESDRVHQNLKVDHRRWFFDADFDLVLWQRGGEYTAIQLCYNKQGDERAITWNREKGFNHYRVDPGEPGPLKNMAPMMVGDGEVEGERLREAFAAHSREIDPAVREFVLARLEAFIGDTVLRVVGGQDPAGVYLVWMRLREAQSVAFGRYRQGRPVSLAAGWYLYVGSAYGTRGAATLANRLLRHATRSGDQPPHRIQKRLAERLAEVGLTGSLPTKKTPRWHVDHLLDLEAADLRSVIVIRTGARIEKQLAEWLAALPETEVFAPGLGASDHPGGTHIFRVNGGKEWWQRLPFQLNKFLTENLNL